MGTSQNFPTPTGGAWTPLKTDINQYLSGDGSVSASQIVGGTIRAAGLAARSPGASGGRGAEGGSGGDRGGAAAKGRGRASVGKAVSGLGGFGAAVRDGGLAAGLEALGLEELRGKPAAEVVARVADHLAGGQEGIQGELLAAAMREALYEAAAVSGDPNLEDLEGALQKFIDGSGPEGLAELFLTHFVFDRIWLVIEGHIDRKTDDTATATAMASAIQASCRFHIKSHMDELRKSGRFEKIDWFGRDGQRIAQDIAGELEARLAGL